MKKMLAACMVVALSGDAFAASNVRPAPPGSFPNSPPEFTEFTTDEYIRGFMALAFGSDLRVGGNVRGVRKFDKPVRVKVIDSGSVKRGERYRAVLRELGEKIPNLRVSETDSDSADIIVRLIDEKDFAGAMEKAFGRAVARKFVARTDPQCMTSARSQGDGRLVKSDVFVIVDKGEHIFLDCAYHETMHAFGLSNHDDKNAWTTLNQNRLVGYLSVYDRALLTALYDPRVRPGMTPDRLRQVLPVIFSGMAPAR